MDLKTEEDVIKVLERAADAVMKDVMKPEQVESLIHIAHTAMAAIRQQNPMKYGYYLWNQPLLYGPFGSTLNANFINPAGK
jgi:hypothetical protein